MNIKVIAGDFTICKLGDLSGVDLSSEFFFIAKTDEEISLVCHSSRAPLGALKRDDGWKMLRIEGVLDFSLVGVLSGLTAILAANGIGVFAISTYNTDYILTKTRDFETSVELLTREGYMLDD